MAVPRGVVSLAVAIGALRSELMHAVWAGRHRHRLHGGRRRAGISRNGGVRSGRVGVDIAILAAPGLPVLAPMSCARLNTGIPARIEDCVGLGFPIWDLRDVRQSAAAGE